MSFFCRHIFCLLFAISYTTLLAEEDKIQALLDAANKIADEKIAQEVDPELIALQMKLPYPVPAPKHSLAEIYKTAIKTTKQEVAEREKLYRDENIFLELREKYRPFKIGEIITIKTNLNLMKTVTGRYNSNNGHGNVQIGKRWVALIDLDNETKARFNPETAEKLIEIKFQQAKQKRDLINEHYEERRLEELTEKLLREDFYLPVIQDKTNPKYLDISNWISMKQTLDKILEMKKKEIRDSVIEEYMTQHNCNYDEVKSTWQSNDAPKPPPATPQPQEKKSLFQKIKKIF